MSLDRTVALKDIPEATENHDFHWVAIGDSDAPGGYTTVLLWRMLSAEVLHKWRWYFDYRAALYKVQNPRKFIEVRWGREQLAAIDPVAHERLLLSRKITACKGKITEWTRKVERAIETVRLRSPMFPFENEPGYANAMAKLEAKKCELDALQKRLSELNNPR